LHQQGWQQSLSLGAQHWCFVFGHQIQMRAALLTFLGLTVSLATPSPAPCDSSAFSALTFGAKGDGQHLDSPAIQAAIAAASACGGGTVLLPSIPGSPSTYLSGPIFLESNLVLSIEAGATLLASPLLSIWMGSINKPSGLGTGTPGLVNAGRCLQLPPANCSSWHKLRNVTVTGGGSIDGNGPSFWGDSSWWPLSSLPRPFLMELTYVDGLTVSHVSLLRSALWTLVPVMSSNILFEHIFLEAGVQRDSMPYNGYNIDGLDSNNVQNMTLRHSVFRAGDDCVAINSRNQAEGFETRNVTIGPNLTCITPITIGSGTGNGIFDVVIRDSVVDARWGSPAPSWKPKWAHTALRFKTARNRGSGGVSNVHVLNITGLGVDLMVDIQSYYSCQNSSGTANYMLCRELAWPTPVANAPSYQNMVFDGLHGDAWRAAWMNCLPEMPCRNISFTNVDLNATEPQWVCEHVFGHASGSVRPSAQGCFAGP
jgi:polygalacturonase